MTKLDKLISALAELTLRFEELANENVHAPVKRKAKSARRPAKARAKQALPTGAWLTPQEVAKICGFSVAHLARLRSTGEGPLFAKLGDGQTAHVRYKIEDVDMWFESRTTGNAPGVE